MEVITKKILIQKSPNKTITIVQDQKLKLNEENSACVEKIKKIDGQEANNKEAQYEIIKNLNLL